ncbi:MAG: hypothetical protein Q9177_005403 [Variospora cf. flavescens]
MDTQVERSVDAHSPRKSEPAPPTTPRSNKRKRNGGSTRSNNSDKQRRNSEYVHQGSHGTESATVDLTTPKSSEGSSSVSPRNQTSSHSRRSRYDSKSPLQRSYQANSTPNGRKRSRSLRRSHRRQPVSAFEAVHIPKSSVCKKPSGAEQTNSNGLQGQLRRQQPSRQAKPFTSIEHQVNPYDGGDTPYSWDEPVVFNISDVEQWKRDNILDGVSAHASPARERDETFAPASSTAAASDVEATPVNKRRRSKKRAPADDGQPESSAAAERRAHGFPSLDRCSSTATRFEREMTAAIDSVSTHINVTVPSGNRDTAQLINESESPIEHIRRLTRQLAAWLREESELAAANRKVCEALLANANALVGKLLMTNPAGLQPLSEAGSGSSWHHNPLARSFAVTNATSNGTTADHTNNSKVPATGGYAVNRREYERQQEAGRRHVRARSAPPRRTLGGVHYQEPISVRNDPPFPMPTRDRGIASNAKQHTNLTSPSTPCIQETFSCEGQQRIPPSPASSHPTTQSQQPHMSQSKSNEKGLRVKTVETVFVDAVGRGPTPKKCITGTTGVVEMNEEQKVRLGLSKKQDSARKRDKGKANANGCAYAVKATHSGSKNHDAKAKQAGQGGQFEAHRGIGEMNGLIDMTQDLSPAESEYPDLATIFRLHNLSRKDQAVSPCGKASHTVSGTASPRKSQIEGVQPVDDDNAREAQKTALGRHYRFAIVPEREQSSSKHPAHQNLKSTQTEAELANVRNIRLTHRACVDQTSNAQDRTTTLVLPSRPVHGFPDHPMAADGRPILSSPNNIWVPPRRNIPPAKLQTQDDEAALKGLTCSQPSIHRRPTKSLNNLTHRQLTIPSTTRSDQAIYKGTEVATKSLAGSTEEAFHYHTRRSYEHDTIAPNTFYQKDALRPVSRPACDIPYQRHISDTDSETRNNERSAADIKHSIEASSSAPHTPKRPKTKCIRGLLGSAFGRLPRPHHLPTPPISSSPVLPATSACEKNTLAPGQSPSSESSPRASKPKKRKARAALSPLAPSKRIKSKHAKSPVNPDVRPPKYQEEAPESQIPKQPLQGRPSKSLKNSASIPRRQASSSSSSTQSRPSGRDSISLEVRELPALNDDDDTPRINRSTRDQSRPSQDAETSKGIPVQTGQLEGPLRRSSNVDASPQPAAIISSSESEERPAKTISNKKQRRAAAESALTLKARRRRSQQVRSSSQDGLPSDSSGHDDHHHRTLTIEPTTTADRLTEANNGTAAIAAPDRARRLATPATAAYRGIAPLYNNPLLKGFKQAGRPNDQPTQPRHNVPHQERASDAELIRICQYTSCDVRRLSAPYAFGSTGKLYTEYHYLVHVDGVGWDDKLKTRMTGKKKADWPRKNW